MKMIEVKVAEATGRVLDYLVERATAAGEYSDEETLQAAKAGTLRYSSDWAKGGPLRDQFRVEVFDTRQEVWAKLAGKRDASCDGPTALIAICRAIVIHLRGEKAKVPAELLELVA